MQLLTNILFFSFSLLFLQMNTWAMENSAELTEEQTRLLKEKKVLRCSFNPHKISSIIVGCNKNDHTRHSTHKLCDNVSTLFVESGVDFDANIINTKFEMLKGLLDGHNIALPQLKNVTVEFYFHRKFEELILVAQSAYALLAASNACEPKSFHFEVLENNFAINKNQLVNSLERLIKPNMESQDYEFLISNITDISLENKEVFMRSLFPKILHAMKFRQCKMYLSSLLNRPDRTDVKMVTCSL